MKDFMEKNQIQPKMASRHGICGRHNKTFKSIKKSLERENKFVTDYYESISAFKVNLYLWKTQLSKGLFSLSLFKRIF